MYVFVQKSKKITTIKNINSVNLFSKSSLSNYVKKTFSKLRWQTLTERITLYIHLCVCVNMYTRVCALLGLVDEKDDDDDEKEEEINIGRLLDILCAHGARLQVVSGQRLFAHTRIRHTRGIDPHEHTRISYVYMWVFGDTYNIISIEAGDGARGGPPPPIGSNGCRLRAYTPEVKISCACKTVSGGWGVCCFQGPAIKYLPGFLARVCVCCIFAVISGCIEYCIHIYSFVKLYILYIIQYLPSGIW